MATKLITKPTVNQKNKHPGIQNCTKMHNLCKDIAEELKVITDECRTYSNSLKNEKVNIPVPNEDFFTITIPMFITGTQSCYDKYKKTLETLIIRKSQLLSIRKQYEQLYKSLKKTE